VTLADGAPVVAGRQWSAAQFADRDAVLAALGVPRFGQRRRASSAS